MPGAPATFRRQTDARPVIVAGQIAAV